MLVIRRRRGEAIVIGEEIEIEILEATPSQVKLGIRAPKSVSVLRKEIVITKQLNQASAVTPEAAENLSRLAASFRPEGVAVATAPASESAAEVPVAEDQARESQS